MFHLPTIFRNALVIALAIVIAVLLLKFIFWVGIILIGLAGISYLVRRFS